jgi:TrmH family RNA methyltransferase
MEQIESIHNPKIRHIVRLKQKKYRDQYNAFFMEGIRSTEEAVLCGCRSVLCFVTAEAADNQRVQNLMLRSRSLEWRFFVVPEPVMKELGDTEHGQGICAAVPKPSRDIESLRQPLPGQYVVLDRIQDPGNMGTLIRTAAAAGCRGVLAVRGCTDPFGEKAVRSSMGAVLRIPVYENVEESCLEVIRDASGIPFIGTALSGAVSYRKTGPFPHGFFVFGNEGGGISDRILSLCSRRVFIPVAAGVESLNVTAAAAVILFHYAADFEEWPAENGSGSGSIGRNGDSRA